jgi:hypothetical protein
METTPRPLFGLNDEAPTAQPVYRFGCRMAVYFGPSETAAAAMQAFYERLPKYLLAASFVYDSRPAEKGRGYTYSVGVECYCTNDTPATVRRAQGFFKRLQALHDSLPPAVEPPAPPASERQALAEQLMKDPPRQFGRAAPKVPLGTGTGNLFG